MGALLTGCNWYTQVVSKARQASEIIQVLQLFPVMAAPSRREHQGSTERGNAAHKRRLQKPGTGQEELIGDRRPIF